MPAHPFLLLPALLLVAGLLLLLLLGGVPLVVVDQTRLQSHVVQHQTQPRAPFLPLLWQKLLQQMLF